jgi:5'-nucleotidase
MEGAILGVPSLAVSIAAFEHLRFDVASAVALTVATAVLDHRLPADTLLNINVPNVPGEQLKGVAITRQGVRRYLSALERRADPRGRPYYWLTGSRTESTDEPGTDGAALVSGYVSVTPLHLNMTDERLLETLRSWNLSAGRG